MPNFIDVPFDDDPETLLTDAIDGLRTAIPGWEPADGNLEVWLLTAFARIAGEVRTVAAQVPSAVFRQFGTSLIQLPPLDGLAATLVTTWTAADTLGHVIPAGTQVGYRVSGDTLIVFAPQADVIIPSGSASLSGIGLTATEVGGASNGVPIGALELIDALSWVSTVTVTSPSTGGVDAETDDAYLARLSANLQLLSPRPILPGDFAVLAQRVAGVARALAVDGYNPTGPTSGNERTVCLFPLDAAGTACDSMTRTAVVTYLDSLREVGFQVFSATPTTTTVNAAYTVHVLPGFDPTATTTAVTAAITSYLSPATWGGGDQSPPLWLSGQNKVRYLSVVTLINNVAGIGYVSALTLNSGTSDVTLSGVAPLPAVGTITATLI